MKTKEEIQAQIEILEQTNEPRFDSLLDELYLKLQSAKSIKDLQREAFEAGRTDYLFGIINSSEFSDDLSWKYKTFEDYLKVKENGTTE